MNKWVALSVFLILCVHLKVQTKTYDCFLFFNELDVLEIRLNELYNEVDYFVLVESVETFRGKIKPLYYEENKERFEKFEDKIIHIIVEEQINSTNPWTIEAYQRNQIMRGLNNCESDDVILVSDVDEIIRASVLPLINHCLFIEKIPYLRCSQILYRFYLNSFDYVYSWEGTCATTFAHMSQMTPEGLRINRQKWNYPILPDAGWHFTSMGGPASVAMKLESFSHPEQDLPESKTIQGIYGYMRNHCAIRPFDNSYPEFVLKNLPYYSENGFVFEPVVEVKTNVRDIL